MAGLQLKYFVLNPTSSDPEFRRASKIALEAFADYIETTNQKLADDIFDWLEDLRTNKN